MNLRTAIRLLIGFGATLLIYGFFMDTTVEIDGDRYINQYLAARQLKFLVGGGIVLLAGVLLYGFRLLKQSSQETAEEKAQDATEREEQERRVREITLAVAAWLTKARNRIRKHIKDRVALRLVVGLIAGGWSGYVAGGSLPFFVVQVAGGSLNAGFFDAVYEAAKVMPIVGASLTVLYVLRSTAVYEPLRRLLWGCFALTVPYCFLLSYLVIGWKHRVEVFYTEFGSGSDSEDIAFYTEALVYNQMRLGCAVAMLLLVASALFVIARKAKTERIVGTM